MSLQEIETAVSKLPSDELAAFRRWFLDFDGERWRAAAKELDNELIKRSAGPFESLEDDWKQRVRESAAGLRDA